MTYSTFKWVYPDPAEALVSAVRGMVIARPLHRFLVGDFSQIEALVLAWLAGQDNVLTLKRAGGDLYCNAASTIYERTITKADKDERQVGKTSILALGYGGGIGSFAKMAESYGVSLKSLVDTIVNSASDEELYDAEKSYFLYSKRTEAAKRVSASEGFVADIIKQRWRSGNPKIVEFWSQCESAAIQAVATGLPVNAGPVCYFVHGNFLHCRLPSGRTIAYPFPKLDYNQRGRATLSYRSADPAKQGIKRGWTDTYGGALVENIVQAVARDLMTDAIKRLWRAGYRVVLTIHDEIVCEVLRIFGSKEMFVELMSRLESWATGMVIEIDAWEGDRYDKR